MWSWFIPLTTLSWAVACHGYNPPQFEVYWESRESYLYNEDELHNPWYIDLGKWDIGYSSFNINIFLSGNIEVGPPGNLKGPSIVTIGFADICTAVFWCQESFPDEFCSKYPPEGIPARY